MSELITINTEKIIDDFDEDYLISTIKLFLEETYVDNLNKMEEGYKNKDKSKIKVAAHTVKSSSGYLGCPYFSKQCEKMEEIAKNGTWDDVEGFWKEYRTNYELLYNCAKKVYDDFTKKREDDNAFDNIMEENLETKIDKFEFNVGEVRSDKLKNEMGDKHLMNKIKSFIETEYEDVKNKINTSFENRDTYQLCDYFESVKSYSNLFGFFYVAEKVDEALKLIRSNMNVRIEDNFINPFLSMFEYVYKECKQSKDNERLCKRFIKVVNSEHLNRLINMANSSKKQLTQISPVEQLRNSNPSSNNGTGTVQQKSPGMKKQIIGPSMATVPVASNPKTDDIYRKLHKVKFEGLYKKEYDVKTFNEEVQKILTPITEEKKTKKIGKSKINTANEYKVNNDYPFKQEKYSCGIF